MKNVCIRDLYAGKPDAKDEINFESFDDFIKTFVVADHFNINNLIEGSHCYITGFKGTGKTALLFYLDDCFSKLDPHTCSSFIFFKEDFSEAKRNELQTISRRLLSSIAIDPDALADSREFEYIWRWLLLKRIVADNEECSRNLFVDDENWNKFEKTLAQISDPINQKKSIIPNKVKLNIPYKDIKTGTETGVEFEVDLRDRSNADYAKFARLIDEAESCLASVKRTDIPYYIFVDELEAYYGEQNVFFRDLCMIRDLIITIKRYNLVFVRMDMKKTKFICSVRSEILKSIEKFIITKEMNKAIEGFSVPLIWSYSNTSSYAHPIIQILLKRISVCVEEDGFSDKQLYEKWFPEKIRNIEPANYILNNSWCKPRDMVRLLSAAKNSIRNNSTSFTQAVFDCFAKSYSEDSLSEIKEEMRALYSADQIDTIISCFMGYKTYFSVKELRKRISENYPDTILETEFGRVIDDLYRLGFIGNFLPISKTYRWQHKGDARVILSDEWRLFVHYALHGALSLGSQQNYGLTRGKAPQIGDVSQATVIYVAKSRAFVEFRHCGHVYKGSIHISEFAKVECRYIDKLNKVVNEGNELTVCLKDYSEKHKSWNLELVIENKQ